MCCALLCVHSSIAVILMGRRGLVALLDLSSWCLVMVEQLFLAVQRGCLQFVIVIFPDHTHSLFFKMLFVAVFLGCTSTAWVGLWFCGSMSRNPRRLNRQLFWF